MKLGDLLRTLGGTPEARGERAQGVAGFSSDHTRPAPGRLRNPHTTLRCVMSASVLLLNPQALPCQNQTSASDCSFMVSLVTQQTLCPEVSSPACKLGSPHPSGSVPSVAIQKRVLLLSPLLFFFFNYLWKVSLPPVSQFASRCGDGCFFLFLTCLGSPEVRVC